MRNISHGARCARILERLSEAIEPGLQLSDTFVQRQGVMLGPVGSRFWRVTFADGAWNAEAFHFEGKDKYTSFANAVRDRLETYDSIESALSMAVRWMTACLSDDREVVDYVLSFREWEQTGLRLAREKVVSEKEALMAELQELRKLKNDLKSKVCEERKRTELLSCELRMLRNGISRMGSERKKAKAELVELKKTTTEGD